ncbi:nose resistant to fluoxetine protein 6-like [Tachypleus tridentatus]|uniref:nose resistant to fluoxetine protein 6-like n=1 Tax=Tachypleus tridentatus TaxID=6853 RepID=UPI003FD4A46B
MTVLLGVVSLVVISTVLEMFIHEVREINLRLRRKQINGSLEILCDQQVQSNTADKVIQVLRALSLKKNAEKLLNTSTSEESIDILHGIRFITIVWIITGHSCSFAVQWLFFKGGVNMKSMSQTFWIQPLVNGTLSVDTFFFLSGFLVTLLTLKQLTKSEGKLPLAWFYFHRYWRMTPLMMAIIAFSAVLLRYVGEGPAWLDTIIMYDTWCKKNWWLNALYLHNFINTNNMCLSHTWYSAVDFQLYIISPLIIYPLYRGLRWGLPVLLGFFIATSVLTGVITGTQHLPPIPVLNDAIPANVLDRFSSIMYIKPYCRAGPYLVGMALGYILFKFPGDIVLKKKYVVLGWFLAATCNILVLYGMWPVYKGNLPSDLSSAMYSALARTAWAVGLAWLTFACKIGYGGFIKTFLSWRPFIPLSRLTYSAYLIHPVIMSVIYGVQNVLVDATFSYAMYLIFGNILTTFIVAFVLSLIFEFPFAGLEKFLLHSRKTTERS